jgi:hypothetical protein
MRHLNLLELFLNLIRVRQFFYYFILTSYISSSLVTKCACLGQDPNCFFQMTLVYTEPTQNHFLQT